MPTGGLTVEYTVSLLLSNICSERKGKELSQEQNNILIAVSNVLLNGIVR